MIGRLDAPHARKRFVVMLGVGVVAAGVTALAWNWQYAPLIGWGAAAATFSVWVWLVLGRLDADQTKRHSTAEDPSRAMIDTLLLLANIASLVAVVVVVLVQAASAHGAAKAILAGMAVLSVALSWLLVQTLYTLRYASLFYTEPVGGIDFNQDDPPAYEDFAYLSFTLGMTYQVSDTNLRPGHASDGPAPQPAVVSVRIGDPRVDDQPRRRAVRIVSRRRRAATNLSS